MLADSNTSKNCVVSSMELASLAKARPAVTVLLAGISLLAVLPPMAAAQTGAWAGNGPQGGKIYCVAADPARPAILYSGTARGVFKSEDAGASWRAIGQGLPSVRVQTIVIDPAATNVLYAGTITPSGVASVGIFKSTDGGETWNAINDGLIDPSTGISPLDVGALAIDPSNHSRLLAGTSFSEIFQSTDGGTTWQPETFGGATLGLQTTAFLYSHGSPSTVFAAGTLGLLVSTDGGLDWSRYGNAGVPFFTLAADLSAPGTLYAGDSQGSGIWKSTDNGAHWSSQNSGLPTNSGREPLILSLVIDPANASTVYSATYGNGVFVSTNAGGTWSASNGSLRSMFVYALAFSAGPGRALYAGTDGAGVAQSTDGARSWTAKSSGLDLGLVYKVIGGPLGTQPLLAAAFDGVWQTSDEGATWQLSSSGLPVAPVDGLFRIPGDFAAAPVFAATLGGGLYKSGDGGGTWSAVSGLSEQFLASLSGDAAGATLYAGTADPNLSAQRVFQSKDGGATWVQTSLDAGSATVDFLQVNPVNASQVIAGSQGGTGYFQSTDAGKNWSTVAVNTACGGINQALFSASGSTLYLAGTTGVCRSTDSGKTWALAAVPGSFSIASLALDPADARVLYAGAALNIGTNSSSVFRSTDSGQTWQSFGGASFPNATVTAIRVGGSGEVDAATYGAGVLRFVGSANRSPIDLAAPGPRPTRSVSPR